MGYSYHFGVRRIAEDDARADRLVAALKASGGSLAVSWLNFGEYPVGRLSQNQVRDWPITLR